MSEDYKVEAELLLKNSEKPARDAAAVAREVRRINAELGRAQHQSRQAFGQVAGMLSSMGGRLSAAGRSLGRTGLLIAGLGTGAAALGLRAAVGAVRELGRAALEANQNVEDTTLSIAALYSEIERVSFTRATQEARGLYRQMEQLALSSPGTTRDLADMFSAAYGPMRRAGTGMQTLLTFSRDAVSVASALHIDYAQVSRDISMMATGVAGQDVATFRLLRSMGMITESTEEWNRMAQRSPAQAAQRMVEIFSRLGGTASREFGRTWSGISSSTRDLTAHFARAFSSPAFEVLKRSLAAVNTYLLRHRAALDSALGRFGTRFAGVLQAVIDRAGRAFTWVVSNFDTIHARFDATVERLREAVPMALKVVQAGAALTVGLRGAGMLLGALGTAGSALSGLSALGLGGTAAATTTAAGGTAAATTTAAGGTAAAGGLSAILAPLAAIAAPLAAALAILGAEALAVWRAFEHFGGRLRGMLAPLWGDLQAIGADLMVFFQGVWDVLDPVLSAIGVTIMGGLSSAWGVILPILRGLSGLLRTLGVALSQLSHRLWPVVHDLVDAIVAAATWIGRFGAAIRRLIEWLLPVVPGLTTSSPEASTAATADPFAGLQSERGGGGGSGRVSPFSGGTPPTAPSTRPTTNIDMRGSRIEVRQEFREADPDRVWIQMRDALEREATRRISSGFVPALTR